MCRAQPLAVGSPHLVRLVPHFGWCRRKEANPELLHDSADFRVLSPVGTERQGGVQYCPRSCTAVKNALTALNVKRTKQKPSLQAKADPDSSKRHFEICLDAAQSLSFPASRLPALFQRCLLFWTHQAPAELLRLPLHCAEDQGALE